MKRKRIDNCEGEEIRQTKKRKLNQEPKFMMIMETNFFSIGGSGGQEKTVKIRFIPKSQRLIDIFNEIPSFTKYDELFLLFGDLEEYTYSFFPNKNQEYLDSEVDIILKFGSLFDHLPNGEDGNISINLSKWSKSEQELVDEFDKLKIEAEFTSFKEVEEVEWSCEFLFE